MVAAGIEPRTSLWEIRHPTGCPLGDYTTKFVLPTSEAVTQQRFGDTCPDLRDRPTKRRRAPARNAYTYAGDLGQLQLGVVFTNTASRAEPRGRARRDRGSTPRNVSIDRLQQGPWIIIVNKYSIDRPLPEAGWQLVDSCERASRGRARLTCLHDHRRCRHSQVNSCTLPTGTHPPRPLQLAERE